RLQQLRHVLAHAVLADLEAFLLEVGDDLLHDVVVARLLEIGHDDGLGIGLGLRIRNTQLLGRPQAKEPVAAAIDLEFKLLVVLVLMLATLLAVFERWHAPAPQCHPLNGMWPRRRADQGYSGRERSSANPACAASSSSIGPTMPGRSSSAPTAMRWRAVHGRRRRAIGRTAATWSPASTSSPAAAGSDSTTKAWSPAS